MRDPQRIPRLIERLQTHWERYPDLRLGQLLMNLAHPNDLFTIEDEVLEARLDPDQPLPKLIKHSTWIEGPKHRLWGFIEDIKADCWKHGLGCEVTAQEGLWRGHYSLRLEGPAEQIHRLLELIETAFEDAQQES
jgi:hypothetical protein